MKLRQGICIAVIAVILFSCKEGPDQTKTTNNEQPSNIIYILADDLGYGDIGAYGQHLIETPHIDALAKDGMRFTQHYSSAPVCAPARYMLMTGMHSGHAYIRGNHEWRERGAVWDYRAMIRDSVLEGQIPMPDSTLTLAQRVKDMGYATGLVGKWGLGAPHTRSVPNDMGFDFFYGYNCQRQAHTYYPVHLYKNRKRVYLENDTVPPHTKLALGADTGDIKSYAPFTLKEYAPDLMFRELTGFVDRNAEGPFFLYWASPIPHVALQAPQRWVDHYVEKFGEETPYLGDIGYFPHPNPRAAYAAMISYFDENIGKLVAQLKAKGIYDNTLIIFTSDNGPSFAGGADPAFFDSARPFRGEKGRGKGSVYEGGVRIPMIATWPDQIAPGTVSDHPSVQYDMVATLADIVGYDVGEGTDGVSFAPSLWGGEQQEKHGFMLWEFPEYGGQVALRMGDWKVVRQHLKDSEPPTLELYDLAHDSLEMHNLASKHPEILQKAAEIFEREHVQSHVERFRIPLLENGLLAEPEEE